MIEFQYFTGCPNSMPTLDNLKAVLKELNLNESELNIIEVPDIQTAVKYQFQGSPTILIDGIDIYIDIKPSGYMYSCRVYEFEGIKTGILPKQFIKDKIMKFQKIKRQYNAV